VAATTGELAVAVDPGPDYDADELLRLSQQLRVELVDLDVDAVQFASGGPAPEGAKAAELLNIGGLVVILGLQRHVLRAVVDTVVAWLARQQTRSVQLTLDGDTLDVTGLSSSDQTQLITRWVERHALPG
jgi:hypothetical protein